MSTTTTSGTNRHNKIHMLLSASKLETTGASSYSGRTSEGPGAVTNNNNKMKATSSSSSNKKRKRASGSDDNQEKQHAPNINETTRSSKKTKKSDLEKEAEAALLQAALAAYDKELLRLSREKGKDRMTRGLLKQICGLYKVNRDALNYVKRKRDKAEAERQAFSSGEVATKQVAVAERKKKTLTKTTGLTTGKGSSSHTGKNKQQTQAAAKGAKKMAARERIKKTPSYQTWPPPPSKKPRDVDTLPDLNSINDPLPLQGGLPAALAAYVKELSRLEQEQGKGARMTRGLLKKICTLYNVDRNALNYAKRKHDNNKAKAGQVKAKTHQAGAVEEVATNNEVSASEREKKTLLTATCPHNGSSSHAVVASAKDDEKSKIPNNNAPPLVSTEVAVEE